MNSGAKLTLKEGVQGVHLARRAIRQYLLDETTITPDNLPETLPDIFYERRGVFVTLNISSNEALGHGELRGCIGYPYPNAELWDATISSAISAAVADPRFYPVQKEELDNIVVEVTVLTPPELAPVQGMDLLEVIELGRHGLIVKKGLSTGLLLPQVAPENNFSAYDFLSHTCMKAGIQPDSWLRDAEVYLFEGQIFSEKEPDGEIFEKILTEA
ncbi:MAG: TIGR00296 family protein [Methanosarcinales archaeon]|nr:TIGR00296 family protein [Methanosarcinales archaeon]